jgi:GNAT superfamily N-acetyltransferase
MSTTPTPLAHYMTSDMRPATAGDIGELIELHAQPAQHAGNIHRMSAADLDGVDLERNTRILVDPNTGKIVGYVDFDDCMFSDANYPYMTWFADRGHPDYPDICKILIRWCEHRAVGPIPEEALVLSGYVHSKDAQCIGIYESLGYRNLHGAGDTMSMSLAEVTDVPPVPAGIVVRVLQIDDDDVCMRLTHEAFSESWGPPDRPGNEWELGTWRSHHRGPRALRCLMFGAFDGPAIVATALCTRIDDDPRAVNLDLFAVHKRWRGTGLSRALLLHTLREARATGFEAAELQVFSINTPAVRLYTSAGMHVVRSYLIYEKTLRPGIDTRNRRMQTH